MNKVTWGITDDILGYLQPNFHSELSNFQTKYSNLNGGYLMKDNVIICLFYRFYGLEKRNLKEYKYICPRMIALKLLMISEIIELENKICCAIILISQNDQKRKENLHQEKTNYYLELCWSQWAINRQNRKMDRIRNCCLF